MTVLESYANRLYLGHECQRWSVHPMIIIGGSIADADDWLYIRSAFGARSVLRWTFRFTAEAALAVIRAGKPKAFDYGNHHYHRSFLASVESALVLP